MEKEKLLPDKNNWKVRKEAFMSLCAEFLSIRIIVNLTYHSRMTRSQ